MPHHLPNGIVSVLQTPFHETGSIDWRSFECLIEDAIASGVDGFLAPAVASEASELREGERRQVCSFVREKTKGRVVFILGASAEDRSESQRYAGWAGEIEADAYLIAIPEAHYLDTSELEHYLRSIADCSPLPMIVQDLRWNEDGLSLDVYKELVEKVPSLCGAKIETVPAGPKYTQIRDAFGETFYICGGWAVPQMIEALDRGVDALMPESSMIRVYKSIWNLFRSGDREKAKQLFYRLLPILSFTNQELVLSIAFFKRLLAARGIIDTPQLRNSGFQWDRYNRYMADELIRLYINLEKECLKHF